MTEKCTHDHNRHGTKNLFAALDVVTGQVVAGSYPRFTGGVPGVHPQGGHADKQIHVVLTNVSTYDTTEVKAWLAGNPRATFDFTPVGSVYVNQIETWFGIITKQAICRGTFTSVNAVINRIRAYVEGWNADAEPFVLHRTADEILARVAWFQTNVKQLVYNSSR